MLLLVYWRIYPRPMKIEDIKDLIVRQWDSKPVADACLSIVDYIASQPAQNAAMLTLSKLGEITGTTPTSPHLIKALSYLTSSLEVMNWKFVYFSDLYEPYYLNSDDTALFLGEHVFIDPFTGMEVEDASKVVYPYLEANTLVLQGKD